MVRGAEMTRPHGYWCSDDICVPICVCIFVNFSYFCQLCYIWLKNCGINFRSKTMPKRKNTWYNGTPCSQRTLRANPLSTFTFRPVPQGKTDNWSKYFPLGKPDFPSNWTTHFPAPITLLVLLTQNLLPPLLLLRRPWLLATSIYPPFEAECLMRSKLGPPPNLAWVESVLSRVSTQTA